MYTNVPKPTNSSYTKLKNGYPLYDDVMVSYDDSGFYFDGDNPMAYTNLAKPTGSSYIKVTKPI